MDRKEFLKKGLFGAGMIAASATGLRAMNNHIDDLKALEPIPLLGFNHLPHTTSNIMSNLVLHKSDTRGLANHGWLQSRHTFSFASYHNPDRMHFGVLRVLNDDIVAAGMGFGTHPHDNMEIISIPLAGDLEHQDSMGNKTVIRHGDIQVMSAGTGIQHSEYNKNKDAEVRFLQIWLFPNKRNVKPRYDQLALNPADRKNKLQQILSPSPEDEGVWIHQDAWFHLADFDAGTQTDYKIKKQGNGVYLFNLNGDLNVNGQAVSTRDGIGIWDTDSISIKANSDAEFLVMDVPMMLS